VAGLGPASYHDPARFSAGFGTAMIASAGLLAAAAVLSALTIRSDALRAGAPGAGPQCKVSCPVGAPPLEPGRDAALVRSPGRG
jgi:hypothetical protein